VASGKNKLKGLGKHTPLNKAAAVLLYSKYKRVHKLTLRYIEDRSVDNLHKLRISFRRLRFSLENFEPCYKKEEVKYLLKSIKKLQDILGEIRDLDVLSGNLDTLGFHLSEDGTNELLKKIEQEKERIEALASSELILFTNDHKVSKFFS
jgi:CHAD domain-containing protein